MSNIELILDPDISLDSIQTAMENGVSALRSPHVGNAHGYNLAVAGKRIPMLLVDHNIASQQPHEPGDRNYLPGSIVTREGITPMTLSAAGGLALRTTTTCPEGRYQRYVDELHVMSLQAAFPDTPITTNTDYMRTADALPITAAIVRATETVAPHLFTRKIEAGEAIPLKAPPGMSFVEDIARYGIMQLNDDPRTDRGVLLPNMADMVKDFVIEALRSGRQTQIHLSGPDMQNYTKDERLVHTLNDIYTEVKRTAHFGKDLPETLTVRLVPADHAQFVTTAERQDGVQRLFALLDRIDTEVDQPKRAFFTTDAAKDAVSRENFIAASNTQKTAIVVSIQEVLQGTDEILGDPKGAPFLSQYDLLAEGGMYVPNQNNTMTMRELKSLAARIRKLKEIELCTSTP